MDLIILYLIPTCTLKQTIIDLGTRYVLDHKECRRLLGNLYEGKLMLNQWRNDRSINLTRYLTMSVIVSAIAVASNLGPNISLH